jgi:hypothetical protein
MNGKSANPQIDPNILPVDLFSYVPKFVSLAQKKEFINDLRDILLDLRCKLQTANTKTNFFLYAALSQKTNTKVTSIRLALENKHEKYDPDEVKVLEAIRNSSKNFSNKYINDMNNWRTKAELLEQEIEKYQELLEKVKDTKISNKSSV